MKESVLSLLVGGSLSLLFSFRRRIEMEFNRLPRSVMEDILARLPMLEAVRTSQLSREWRHRWKSIPRLSFDRTGFPPRPGEETSEYERRVVKAVSHALLLHAGPIHEFKLSTHLRSCPDVDVWLWALSRKGVRRIVLDFWKAGDAYKLPSGLFECELLNHPELFQCVLSWLPATFKGFRHLLTLDLQRSIFTGDDLERLISTCPLLKNLELLNNQGCDEIIISAPNLKKLTLVGSFRHLHLRNTPMLATASIDLTTAVSPHGRHETGGNCYLIQLFSALACVEKLEMENHFLGALSAGNIPERLPAALKRLKNINMDVNLEDLKECTAALCLFRSCPSLETLKIHHRASGPAGSNIITDFWDAKDGLDCEFNELISMEIPDVVGAGPEMAFMGFALANAPKLAHVNVRLDKVVSNDIAKFKMVTKSLLSCPRASARARIILLE